PDLPAAADVPGHGHPGGFDLSVRDPARLHGEQAVVAEVHLGATLRLPAHPAAVLLAVLDPLGHQHLAAPPRTALARTATRPPARRGPGAARLGGLLAEIRRGDGRDGGTALDLPRVGDQRTGRRAGRAALGRGGDGAGPGPFD